MRRRKRTELWTDIIIVGGSLLVITVSLTTGYLHWRDAHNVTAAESITKTQRKSL